MLGITYTGAALVTSISNALDGRPRGSRIKPGEVA